MTDCRNNCSIDCTGGSIGSSSCDLCNMNSDGNHCPYDCEGACDDGAGSECSGCTGTCTGSCGDQCTGDCGGNCVSYCNTRCSEGCFIAGCRGTGKAADGGGTGSSANGKVEESNTELNETSDEYLDDIINEQYEFYGATSDSLKLITDPKYNKIKLLRGVSGMPYQFLPDTDRRIFSSTDKSTLNSIEHMGRKYTERIAQRANILFLTPGKASFLKGASKKTKINVLNAGFSNLYEASAKSILDDGTYRYYSFDFDTENYYRYLNPMCRAAARYLGLQNYTIYGKRTDTITGLVPDTDLLTHANYENLLNGSTDHISLFANGYGALTYYLDGVSTGTDSISTNLGDSQLVNQFLSDPTDMAQEIKFLSGRVITDLTDSALADLVTDHEKVKEGQAIVEDFAKKYLFNNNLAKVLGAGAVTVLSGGQIIFPKLWKDTTWDTDSVTVTVKLVSPDPDDFSIFTNILVPMYSLVAMAAPKGYIGIDGYSQPFMVRAFCQSMFNIEAGFITALSISKGGEGYWTASGLPTVLEINLTISDIYDGKYISTSEKLNTNKFTLNPIKAVWNGLTYTFQPTPFLKNTAMLNWIANTCGVNVNKPDVVRDIEMYIEHTLENPVLDIFVNFNNRINDFLRNLSPEFLNILGSQFR